eukprot:1768597-Pyramimonas_sp.AAC.1
MAGGVILHATNAADKLLMLKTLQLYDHDANRAFRPDTLVARALVQHDRVPVVTYHPEVDLRMTNSEYIGEVLHTLAAAAALSRCA